MREREGERERERERKRERKAEGTHTAIDRGVHVPKNAMIRGADAYVWVHTYAWILLE